MSAIWTFLILLSIKAVARKRFLRSMSVPVARLPRVLRSKSSTLKGNELSCGIQECSNKKYSQNNYCNCGKFQYKSFNFAIFLCKALAIIAKIKSGQTTRALPIQKRILM